MLIKSYKILQILLSVHNCICKHMGHFATEQKNFFSDFQTYVLYTSLLLIIGIFIVPCRGHIEVLQYLHYLNKLLNTALCQPGQVPAQKLLQYFQAEQASSMCLDMTLYLLYQDTENSHSEKVYFYHYFPSCIINKYIRLLRNIFCSTQIPPLLQILTIG